MLLELIWSPQFWGLIGVVVGLLIGEVIAYLRYRFRVQRLKKLIEEELWAIRAQIPQKKDIVEQILAALEKKTILSGVSIDIINTGYKQHIGELYEHLSLKQRNCLHVIHGHLESNDRILCSIEQDIIAVLHTKVLQDPFEAYRKRFCEILNNYDVVESLIRGYLDGKPVDVFIRG